MRASCVCVQSIVFAGVHACVYTIKRFTFSMTLYSAFWSSLSLGVEGSNRIQSHETHKWIFELKRFLMSQTAVTQRDKPFQLKNPLLLLMVPCDQRPHILLELPVVSVV